MNDSDAETTKPASVDMYLCALPNDKRVTLERLRKTIKSVVPDATEVISYRVPAFKYKGRQLVAFAAFKNHCSFFPMSLSVMEAHKRELRSYDTVKGTIHFPASKPLPATLVAKLVKARIAENEERAAKKD
jgi:uncharacterized protein YdhG (YjbR/CyaY superfamily)